MTFSPGTVHLAETGPQITPEDSGPAAPIFYAENGYNQHGDSFSKPLQQVLDKSCNEVESCTSEENPSTDHLADIQAVKDGQMTMTDLKKKYSGEYTCWKNLKQRCRKFQGEGVPLQYAQDFETFTGFLSIMGPKPFPSASVDRKDVAKGYYPDNVRWANKQTQATNKGNTIMLTYEGETRPLSEWSTQLKIPYSTLKYRQSQGWTDQEVIEGKPEDPTVPDYIRELPWPEDDILQWEVRYTQGANPAESRVEFMARYATTKLHEMTASAETYLKTLGLPRPPEAECTEEAEEYAERKKQRQDALRAHPDYPNYAQQRSYWQDIKAKADSIILADRRRKAYIHRQGGLGAAKERRIFDWLIAQGWTPEFDPARFPPPKEEPAKSWN